MRRLIVNADDFGLTAGVNRGIVEAHTRGVVTSSTLMACGLAFENATTVAKQAPSLSIGCHVLLVDGWPTLPFEQVSTLASANSDRPRFRDSLAHFAFLAAARRLDEDQIEAEIIAQIRKLHAAGIQVSHLDSHKHAHMFPVVFRPMLRAAKKCGVPAVRNPFEPLLFTRSSSWKRQFQLGVLSSFRASFREALNDAGLKTPDGCIGIVATGGLNLKIFCELIENLPEGTWEFVSHPGYNDADLAGVKTRLHDSREKELAVLTAPEVRELLDREQVELISYRDFVQNSGQSTKVPPPSVAAE